MPSVFDEDVVLSIFSIYSHLFFLRVASLVMLDFRGKPRRFTSRSCISGILLTLNC
jgi:hypothetical protein